MNTKFRYTYSLFFALAIFSALALVAALLGSIWKEQSIRNELDRVYKQSGLIRIVDETMIHVRSLGQPSPDAFAFNVVLPAEGEFDIVFGEGGFENGFEMIVKLPIENKNRTDNRVRNNLPVSVYFQKSAFGWDIGFREGWDIKITNVPGTRLDWIRNSLDYNFEQTTSTVGHHQVISFDEGQRAVLFGISDLVDVPPTENFRTFSAWVEPREVRE